MSYSRTTSRCILCLRTGRRSRESLRSSSGSVAPGARGESSAGGAKTSQAGSGPTSRLRLMLWKTESDLVVRRRRFEQRLAPGHEPRVSAQNVLALAADAEDDARLDAFERKVAVEHGRALPARRREKEEVCGQHGVEQAREPLLHLRRVGDGPP